MAIDIVLMTERDIPAAVKCVQTAFAEDPYFRWMFTASRVRLADPASYTYRNHHSAIHIHIISIKPHYV